VCDVIRYPAGRHVFSLELAGQATWRVLQDLDKMAAGIADGEKRIPGAPLVSVLRDIHSQPLEIRAHRGEVVRVQGEMI
jgi:hypothetical protein